jgi:hypothetical protein
MKIKTDTKELRKRKGIIPIATLFIRLYQVFGHPEGYKDDLLRMVTCISMCLAHMLHLADLYTVGREDIFVDPDKRFMLVPLFGNKNDYKREGMIDTIWRTDGNPFDPIELWTLYEEKSREVAPQAKNAEVTLKK